MEKDFKFAIENIQKLNVEEYDENEYCVGRMKFLSTRPNSHGIRFSEEVLRRDAKTMLGKWVVAEILAGDFTTHVPNEHIIGIVPKEQEIEFVEADDGYLDAYVDVVLSKRYAKDAYDVFVKDNDRSVSIEFNYTHPEDDEQEVESFIIRGVTALGKSVNPSVPTANLTITRFSEEEADKFFAKVHSNSLTTLRKFVEERKELMAEKKNYKVDKSKDAMSETPWGDVDKIAMRDKIMEASNRNSLVKSVYMLVEDGWEDAPSEHLKYPVMQLKGDTFVYNRYGLSSALAYAQKENENSVVGKIMTIYKKLGLEIDRKEEDAEMAEIAFAAVDIGDMWGKVFDALHDRYPDGDWGSVYRIDGIYEEDNKKFAIIHRKDEDAKYRLDFSLTEDGLTLSDEIIKVELEIVETDEVKKFAEPENSDKYKKFEDCGCEDDGDDNHEDDGHEDEDFAAKCAEMEKKIEERDNIIMEKDKKMEEMEKELAELREYKNACMEKEKACSVESVMDEVKGFVNDEQFKSLREEGMACEFSQIDAWSNKVKAIGFECGKKSTKKQSDIMSFAAPVENKQNQSGSVWGRL